MNKKVRRSGSNRWTRPLHWLPRTVSYYAYLTGEQQGLAAVLAQRRERHPSSHPGGANLPGQSCGIASHRPVITVHPVPSHVWHWPRASSCFRIPLKCVRQLGVFGGFLIGCFILGGLAQLEVKKKVCD